MARTIAEIKKQMTDAFMANTIVTTLYGLDLLKTFDEQFSPVSIESILFDVVAVCAWSLEVIFGLHVQEVKQLIETDKPGRVPWYVDMVKKFQLGRGLVFEKDYYDNTGLTDAQIEAERIVKYCSAIELPNEMIIKIAGENAGDLAPIPAPSLAALKAYMEVVKYSGIYLTFVNDTADSLKLSLKINYDPLILKADGKRLDGTNDTPVLDAVKAFLKTGFKFDGYFVLASLTDALQGVEGVKVPTILSAQARAGVLPYDPIAEYYNPRSGYLRILIPSDITITYTPSPL